MKKHVTPQEKEFIDDTSMLFKAFLAYAPPNPRLISIIPYYNRTGLASEACSAEGGSVLHSKLAIHLHKIHHPHQQQRRPADAARKTALHRLPCGCLTVCSPSLSQSPSQTKIALATARVIILSSVAKQPSVNNVKSLLLWLLNSKRDPTISPTIAPNIVLSPYRYFAVEEVD